MLHDILNSNITGYVSVVVGVVSLIYMKVEEKKMEVENLSNKKSVRVESDNK